MKIIGANITGSFILNNQDVTNTVQSSSAWSGSVASQIDSLNAATASLYAVSASLNSATASLNAATSSLFNATASLFNATSSLNAATSSLNTASASFSSSIASLNTATASFSSSIGLLNGATASLNDATSSLNSATSSLNAATSSLSAATASLSAATASLNSATSSLNAATASLNSATSSLNAATSSLNTATASFSSSIASLNSFTSSQTALNNTFATTGSNNFVGNQVVSGSFTTSGSITATGTITAQTLVVQTITSSVSTVTGSTKFGSTGSNTHQFTGSLNVTGSLTVTTTGTELQVNSTGVNLGNALTDSHTISGSLTVNPGGLFVSGSGQIVGIGTTVGLSGNSRMQLLIGGNSFGSLIAIGNNSNPNKFRIESDSSENVLFNNLSNTPMIFYTSESERMRILEGGNVGIGTTTPAYTLSVNGTLQSTNYLSQASTTISGLGTLDFGYIGRGTVNGSALLINDIPGANYAIATGGYNLTFYKHVSGSNTFTNVMSINGSNATNATPSVTFANSVGIGTTSPNADLDVRIATSAGGVTIGGGATTGSLQHGIDGNSRYLIVGGPSGSANLNYGIVWVVNNTTETSGSLMGGYAFGQAVSGKSGSNVGTKAIISSFTTGSGGSVGGFGGDLRFSTRPNNGSLDIGQYERMRITMDGNIGIGTTSPSYRLDVSGSIRAGLGNSTALLVAATGTASTQAAIAIQQLTTEGDTIIFADFEPFAEYGIVAKNDIDSIDFNAGNATNSLANYNIVNRSGTTKTAYVKTRIDLTNGYLFVGGRIGIGTISPGVSLDLGSKTDAVRLTNGTTAQRPTAAAGQIRYNTSFNFLEYYDGSNWVPVVGQTSPGSTASNPAESADEIKTYNPNATNGFYWIRQIGTTPLYTYCVFTDFTGAAIAGGPWTVPLISNDANSNFSTNGVTAAATFLSKCQAIGIASPGRGMENTRTTTEVYGAWLAVKRALWNGYSSFITNGNTGAGAVLRMPMININGSGGASAHRLVYNTSLGTHIPPNIDGDACNANQLFCGWWAANDVSGWRVNDNTTPGPEDWDPSDQVNTSYNGSGIQSVLTVCVYK